MMPECDIPALRAVLEAAAVTLIGCPLALLLFAVG